MNGRLSITEVARKVGVTPRTIMRWEKAGKIKRSKRDWRGWRFYLEEDLGAIKRFYESSYEYGEDRWSAADFTKTAISWLLLSAICLGPLLIGGECRGQSEAALSQGKASGAIKETARSVDIDLRKLPAVNAPVIPSNTDAVKYTLGPDDVIEIEVRRHPEFSGQYSVNSEGKIEYKFVGDIVVNGLTKVQLQQKLADILSEYLINPDINVRIMAYLSKVYYVVGEVGSPGKFYMRGNTIKVREALVAAGLPTHSAAMRKCRLITPDNKGRNNYVIVNVYKLLYSGDLKCNLEMKPGDVLYVPSTLVAKIIRVVSPVTTAVSQAGGAAAAGAGMAIGL